MTTTTNYEISNKLAEIGFSRQAFWVWTSKDCCCPYETHLDGFRAYDLETLLDALPKELNLFLGKTWLSLNLSNKSQSIGYGSEEEYAPEFYFIKEENESLADIAGRLIISLYEENLIKF